MIRSLDLAKCLLLIIACAYSVGYSDTAWSDINAAQKAFTAGDYDEAVSMYRKHLRQNPRDYNAWNRVGAAYYHTGLPKRGLRYLKHVERKTSERSYNYYYQGLCYLAFDRKSKAKEFLAYAASRYSDEYASRATFEVAVLEYQARNKERAAYWLSQYMTRFRTGVYMALATEMSRSLQQGRWMKNVKGNEKPDMEAALFKYNNLSLYPEPHYWFFQLGGQQVTRDGQEPGGADGGLKPRSISQQAILANAGIGIGPWREGPMSANAGYTYRQQWLTEYNRIEEYLEEPTDIQYFPFRGDLLERRHQFYGDYRRSFAKRFYYGVYGRYEFARIGSTFYPGPEDPDLKQVLKISDTQVLIPWIGVAITPQMRTLAYLYIRKELNETSPEHSNKTFELGFGSEEEPVFSLGLSHNMEIPEEKIELNFELFRYSFVYNDYWLDYDRFGMLGSVEHELIPRWYVSGLVGYYRDTYLLPRLKLNSCSSTPDITKGSGIDPPGSNANPGVPKACEREDVGFLVQAGLYWNWSQFQRFSGLIQFVNNTNDEQQEFEESKMVIQFQYTMAFPSVKRVSRYVDRYADTAFTKEAE